MLTERIENAYSYNTAMKYLIDKISSVFDVNCEYEGSDLLINGEDNYKLQKAFNVFQAIKKLSTDESVDESGIDYIVGLSLSGELDEFIKNRDEVVFNTFAGRPIKAKTLGQRFYLDSLRKSDLTICAGPAGSGKTFLAVVMAVKAFKNREVSKIIITRPAIEAGEKLGFLPGDMKEKVDPYMRPVFDALNICLGPEMFEKYYEKELIEVSPLAFMRGRNLDDAFVILDEAQNTTSEQMKMFLTRIGINCRVCVCGDFTQVDLPKNIKSGLIDSIEVLSTIDEIDIIRLQNRDIVRNSLVQKIVKAYSDREGVNYESIFE
ncbi:MAG: PhoH family protein [Clostridia bacterium]|nr:PhoH family protein [Clostridia bacterium]